MISNPLKEKNAFLVLFFMICSMPSIALSDAREIFKENSKSVVVIVTVDNKGNPLSQGSGFIVRADGAIVTNYHVIRGASDIKVKVDNKILDVEGLIYYDIENDLAILKAKGEKLPTVKLGNVEKGNIGENIYIISSPQGMENTISDGLLSGIRDIASHKKVLQITAPVSPGSSGSPVFNEDGEVVGITTFLLEESQNLNFAMPVNLIGDNINSKRITSLKKVLEDYKKTALPHFADGLTYSASGKYEEAVEAYKKGLSIDPDDAGSYSFLGSLYGFKLGKYQEALDAYNQAIKINPDDRSIYISLSSIHRQFGKYQEALDACMQGIRIKPNPLLDGLKGFFFHAYDYAGEYVELAFSYEGLGKYKEAVEAYKQAIKINPDHVNAHYFLGSLYIVEFNNKRSALDEYEILKDLDKKTANELFEMIYP